MTDQNAEIESVVTGMIRLAEGLGYTLPWANLIDACVGIASPQSVRRATDDLIDRSVIEATHQGLRFAFAEPLNRPAPTTPEAACSDWPGACQCTPAHDNGRLTPEPRITRPGSP